MDHEGDLLAASRINNIHRLSYKSLKNRNQKTQANYDIDRLT